MLNKISLTIAILSLIGASESWAAPIIHTDSSPTLTASLQYQMFVNNGDNQAAGAKYLGTDPAALMHTAFNNIGVNNGAVVSSALLDLTFLESGPSWSRVSSYFTGVPSTRNWNPTFNATHSPQYTISVSSSAGSNVYSGAGPATELDILSLLNFGSLLSDVNTDRAITVSWMNTIDFVTPAAMPKNSTTLLGANPLREYRWNVSASVTGNAQLRLDTTARNPEPAPVPEPSTMGLLGSSLLAIVFYCRKIKA